MIKNASSRTSALMDGAIRQVRQFERPDGAGSNVTGVCAATEERPQKCVVWTVTERSTPAKHTTARQLTGFVDRLGMFTFLDVPETLDAATGPLSGSHPQRIRLILALKPRLYPISIKLACSLAAVCARVAALFAVPHRPSDTKG